MATARSALDGTNGDTQRNGYRKRALDTGLGTLNLKAPKPRKLAAPHVMHPVGDRMFVRQPFDQAPDRDTAVFEGMGFDHEMMVTRYAGGKGVDRLFEKVRHGREWRVCLETGVMLELQKRQMIREPTVSDPPSGDGPIRSDRRHREQALERAGIFWSPGSHDAGGSCGIDRSGPSRTNDRVRHRTHVGAYRLISLGERSLQIRQGQRLAHIRNQ